MPAMHWISELVCLADAACPARDELDAGLAYLVETGADVRFGDLAAFKAHYGYRNDGVAIFDGEQLVALSAYPDDYGCLPQMFRVLGVSEGDGGARAVFPIWYWHDRPGYQRGETDGSIAHNFVVWFDHRPFRQQLVANWSLDPRTGRAQTFFRSNGETYYVVSSGSEGLPDRFPTQAVWHEAACRHVFGADALLSCSCVDPISEEESGGKTLYLCE